MRRAVVLGMAMAMAALVACAQPRGARDQSAAETLVTFLLPSARLVDPDGEEGPSVPILVHDGGSVEIRSTAPVRASESAPASDGWPAWIWALLGVVAGAAALTGLAWWRGWPPFDERRVAP